MCVWWHVVIFYFFFFDLFINKKCWVDIGCCLIDILHSWLKEINSNIYVLALLANFLRVLLHNIHTHTHTKKTNLFKQNYNERAKKFFLNRFLPATFQIYIFLFLFNFYFQTCVLWIFDDVWGGALSTHRYARWYIVKRYDKGDGGGGRWPMRCVRGQI